MLDALETYVIVVMHSSELNAIEISGPIAGHIYELQIGLHDCNETAKKNERVNFRVSHTVCT